MAYSQLKSAGLEEGVRIEKDEVLSLGLMQSEIIRNSEAEVNCAADQPNLGEVLLYHLG